MSERKVAVAYWEYLSKEGYRPEILSDGLVSFKRAGCFYCIQADEQDPQFFRLIFPNICQLGDQSDNAMALIAADRTTGKIKTSKVFIVEDQVFASVELFVISMEHVAEVFERCIAIVDEAAQQFLEEMQSARK
ncbi:MAG: hypothetical protein AB2535_14655 [Candidatus Thiodiazotropha endolucinida]